MTGWIGLVLVIISWPLSWSLPGVRTHVLHFPLWVGYCLTIDAITVKRTGTSLLTSSPKRYILLFLISAPVWWLFEFLNEFTQNWEYVGKEHFTNLEYALYATLSFSTVIPAIFGSAELVASFKWVQTLDSWKRWKVSRRGNWMVFALGWLFLSLMFIWPQYFFPFLWISVYFIISPINRHFNRRTIWHDVYRGDWRPVVALWLGAWICAFFWEFWNVYAFPKWIYHIPYVGVWHIFEMPLPGYLGYLPFSLELFALYYLIGSLRPKQLLYDRFLQFPTSPS